MSNETRRILLVEDEKAIRDAVTAYLERENYWVTAVGDGQEALEEFSKHHFDLVILDLMLPRNPKWLHTVHGVGYRFEDPTKQGQ